ncbi:Head fiber protein [Bacillota bacterium Meth-B3]
MDDYQTRNYTAHGGRETVIGGKLTFLPGAEVSGLGEALTLPKAPFLPNSEATTVTALRADFNALLSALRAAGLMAPETMPE